MRSQHCPIDGPLDKVGSSTTRSGFAVWQSKAMFRPKWQEKPLSQRLLRQQFWMSASCHPVKHPVFENKAVSLLADAEKLLLSANRVFPQYETEPRSQIAGFLILRPLPIAARSAVAPNAPMPGIVMSRRATSSRGAIASISRVTSQSCA
jgi:hypothetical protein